MRRISKPENVFWTKKHSYSPTMLRELQKQIFQNPGIRKEQHLVELLSKDTRMQILALLALKSSICVGDIADVLRLDISAISHQLQILRKENLVVFKRKGKVVYYGLNPRLPKLVEVILGSAMNSQS